MVGILVTARMARGWNSLERHDIERVGKTLAASCVLDQRSQWLEQRLNQQSATYNQIQDHQQEVLDDVLHQFRNPLTAIRTFGKLLVKRLQPSDRNRTVAESVVRESDRLQDLLTQLSEAVQVPSLPSNPTEDLRATTLLMSGTVEQGEANASVSGLKETEDDESVGYRSRALEGQTIAQQPENYSARVAQSRALKEQGSVDVTASSLEDQQLDADQQDIVRALTGQNIQLRLHDPMDILEPLLLSAYAIAQERQIVLRLTCQDPQRSAMVDDKALREVLSNLIDNALKYTPPGGKIIIESIKEKANFVGIAISDNGPGIPQQDLEHLGERGYRGVQAQTEIPGSGLGLTIAKQLIEQMQGEMEIFSPANRFAIKSPETPGTTFIIRLPEVGC